MNFGTRPAVLRPAMLLLLLGALILAGCGEDSSDGLAVGDDAPDFSLPEAAGGTVSLADYANQPALLYFHMADG